MSRRSASEPEARWLLRDPRFLIATSLSTGVMGIAFLWGDLSLQISVAGVLVSVLIGLVFHQIQLTEESTERVTEQLLSLSPALALHQDADLQQIADHVVGTLVQLKDHHSPVFRQLAVDRLLSMTSGFDEVAGEQLHYRATESWRNAYARVLSDPLVREYFSAAWVRSADYWQDRPGQQSLQLNRDLVARGIPVTRIVILAESLLKNGESEEWPPELITWLTDQNQSGIRIMWVRESELAEEHDLLCDMGIYGDLAVGHLSTNEVSRSLSFRLSFEESERQRSLKRWRRLLLYAHPGLPGQGCSAAHINQSADLHGVEAET